MSDAPVDFNQQVLDPVTAWVSFGFASAGWISFLILTAISLSKRKDNRPRTYRSTFWATLAYLLVIGFYAIRSYGYVNQTVIAWDSVNAIQSGAWDFAVNGLCLVFFGILLTSYAPSADVMDTKKKSKGDSAASEPLTTTVNKEGEDLIFSKNIHHWVPGHTLLGAAFAVSVFGALAMQQAFPLALVPLFSVGFIGLVLLVIYYIMIAFVVVGSIPSKVESGAGDSKKNKKAETKVYRALIAFLLTFGFVSVAGMIVAAGVSPAVATLQHSYSINAASWVMMGTVTASGIIAFFAVLYFDFIYEKTTNRSHIN